MVSMKTFSIVLGILAGTAGMTNSGYNLYKTFVVTPNLNAEHNRSLLNQVPLIIEMVEIEPDPGMAMRVEVTLKVFKTGDILVESGNRREFIPFRLHNQRAMLDIILPSAYAAETTIIDGVEYEVENIRFVESATEVEPGRLKRVRKYADGTVETSLIDMRSNKTLETHTEKAILSEKERQEIERSPYKKKVFRRKQ
jgi:hypothetical protein